MKVKTKIIWTVVFSVMLVLLIVLLALTSDTILRWHNFYIDYVEKYGEIPPIFYTQHSEFLIYFTYWIVIICFAVFMLCLIYGLWHKNIVTAVRMKKYNTVKIEQVKKEKKKKKLQEKYEKLKKEMEHCE